MKIQQNCSPSSSFGKVKDLPQNTIFKMKGTTITWLKIPQGYFDLTSNSFWGVGNFGYLDSEVDLIYPNARIVLE